MEMVVGRIGRAHGVRGELSVEVRTDAPDERFVPGARLTTDPATAGPLVLRSVRKHQDRLLVCFDGVPDRTTAERLRGVLLLADVADAGPEGGEGDDDAWYDHDLVGLQARQLDGTDIGRVVEVLHRPAQDALVVRRADGRRIQVPFVSAIVPTVDVGAGFVVLDPPVGLLDPESISDDPASISDDPASTTVDPGADPDAPPGS